MTYSKSSSSEQAAPSQDIRSIPGVACLRRGVFLSWMRRLFLLTADVLAISFAWLLAKFLDTPTAPFFGPNVTDFTLIPVLAIALSLFSAGNLYRSGNSRRNYLGVFKAISLAVLVLLLIGYFYNPDQFISRPQFLMLWSFSILFVGLTRFAIDQLTHLLRLRGAIRYPALIIADVAHRDRALELVEHEQRYRVTQIVDAQALDRANRAATFEQIQQLDIAEVFVSWDAIKNRMFLGQRFQALGITLNVVPVEQEGAFGGANIHMLSNHTPCVSFYPAVIAGADFWLKRSFDIVFALLAVTLMSPIYLLIAAAIRVDSAGPTFYKQTRIGLHGQPFKVWKFRSMVPNADKQQAKLEELNQTKDGVLFKIKSDPRITRVGSFIRRYSLDELPQIFNVLLGEMSLVGPRPLPVRDVEKFKEHYFIRQDVLPGITGLWQVSGRSDIDNFDDVLKLDLYYIQNWSIWLDISILLRTFAAVLKKSGAY